MRQLDVSVIIVNWNTRAILRNCLQSIYEQTTEVDFELIVIDNASTDGSAEMVRKEFPEAIVVENAENRGFAAANNQGMAVAKGRYVLLLNSDTLVLDQAIAKIVFFADVNRDAAVVTCRVLNPDKTLQLTCFMFPSLLNMFLASSYLYKLFPCNRFFGRERMTWWQRDDIREVDVATGCFLLVRRGTVQCVGPMDERFFMYGEDTDWCYRFRKAGYKIIFTPHAEIIHYGGESSKQIHAKSILLLRDSRLQFFKKHRGRSVYWMACLMVALFFVLRLPYWGILSLFSQKDKRSEYRTIAYTYLVGAYYTLTVGRCVCPEK